MMDDLDRSEKWKMMVNKKIKTLNLNNQSYFTPQTNFPEAFENTIVFYWTTNFMEENDTIFGTNVKNPSFFLLKKWFYFMNNFSKQPFSEKMNEINEK